MFYKNKALILSFLIVSTTTLGNLNYDKNFKKIIKPHSSLVFEENKGQFDKEINYLSKGKGYNIALSQHPVIELFRYKPVIKSDPNLNKSRKNLGKYAKPIAPQKTESQIINHALIQLQILGSNNKAKIIPQKKVVKKSNYISGKKSTWITNVNNYSSIRYEEILKGVDVVYYGNDGKLEYDFIVKPNAKASDVKLNFIGVDGLSINNSGQLVMKLGDQEIIQNAPITYQLDQKGNRIAVDSKYTNESGSIGFAVGNYDKTRNLVIDPVLEYSRYYGGSKNEDVYAVDLDASDNIYMIGHTQSQGLANSGSFQNTNKTPIRVEQTANLNCIGCTDAPDLINNHQVTRKTINLNLNKGVFVTKFSPDGNTVLWSTYFSSEKAGLNLGINSAAVSATGEVAFGLTTGELPNGVPDDLPTINSNQTFSNFHTNTYVAKLNANGNNLIFSSYINIAPKNIQNPGSLIGWLRGLDVAADGSVVAVGFGINLESNSEILLPEVNPISGQSCVNSENTINSWVIKFNSIGVVDFASCIRGNERPADFSFVEDLSGVKFGSNGHIYTVGRTGFIDFPIEKPVQSSIKFDTKNLTITEIDPNEPSIVFSTFLGPMSNGNEDGGTTAYDIEVDSSNNIYVTGVTNQPGWQSKNAAQPNLKKASAADLVNATEAIQALDRDFFITKINTSVPSIEYSTFLGGSFGEDDSNSLTIDSGGNVYLLGITHSANYPVTNATKPTISGASSVVVSKLSAKGALVYSSYLGGTDNNLLQVPGGIAINSAGKIIIGTKTLADDWNLVGSSTTRAGGYDATLSIINQSGDVDTDADGVIDSLDTFPSDPLEWLDTDSDMIGDNADNDDDGDGILDSQDRFPLDSSEALDTDNDAIGDNADKFPNDKDEYFDIDGNGIGDLDEEDSDKDNVANSIDFAPLNSEKWFDIDGDGIDDYTDSDIDGDGLLNANDIAPTNPNDPVITFNNFVPINTDTFKSPLPNGFSTPSGSDQPWTVVDGYSINSDGSISRGLGNLKIQDNQTSILQYDETFAAGTLSFKYKVDSDSNNGGDTFIFRVDGIQQVFASGKIDWTTFSMPITAGAHTLTWTYSKNASDSVGLDGVIIDDLSGIPIAPVDLVTTVVNDDGVIVSNGKAHYTITVYNNSPNPTVNSELIVNWPPEFSNVTWTCKPNLSNNSGTSCAATTTSSINKSFVPTMITENGTGNIRSTFDIGGMNTIEFEATADVQNIPPGSSVTVTAGANVSPNVRETNTSNNTVSQSSKEGILVIFKDGFDK